MKRVPSKILRFYANLVAPFVASHLLVLVKLKRLVTADPETPITGYSQLLLIGIIICVLERQFVQEMLNEESIGSDLMDVARIPGIFGLFLYDSTVNRGYITQPRALGMDRIV